MLDYIHGSKKRLAAAVGAALLAGAFSIVPRAEANPVLDAKDAAVSISGTTNMNITSGATNNLIKWVDFSIGKNESVNFNDTNNYLNYVTGSARSDILGTLTGGGHIWLVNPNGILIGDGATVNVGSLYLSTKNLTADQLANYSAATGALFKNDNAAVGDVINLGNLNANVISVEGNNITFKNVANVKNAAGTAINTNVTLTANSGGEIHIGSAAGAAAAAVNDEQYKGVTLSTPTGWTMNRAAGVAMYMLVRNAYELQNMQNNLSGNYMLAKDIDAEPIAAFTPVGKGSNSKFMGKFDGLDYQVSNLKISVDTTDGRAGLFGFNSGTIENLEVKGMTVTNNSPWQLGDVGAVAAYNGGTLRNVRNTGAIDCSEVAHGVDNFGGIVGFNMGTIERAYNTGSLVANSDKYDLILGGVAGRNSGAITNVFNAGALTDKGSGTEKSSDLGGIAGYMESGRVENAYNSGALKSDSQKDRAVNLGGIVGYLHDGTVQHTYNSGTLEGKNKVGGISGTWGGVTDSYSTQEGNVNNGVKLTADNKMKQDTYAGFDFSANGAWRIYEGNTMPLLTAFMTRADHDNGTKVYNGAATGDVGTNYSQTVSAYNAGAQNQIGGVNYVRDYTKVTPKALTITAGSIDKEYDGTTDATLTADNLSGVVAGDELTVSTTSTTYADKNVGTGKTVTYAGLTLGGDKAKNYTIAADGTGTGDISKANITISVENITKTYDGTTKTDDTTDAAGGKLKVTSGTLYDGDTMSGGTKTYTDVNAGTNKTVTVSGVTIDDGNNGGNYNVTYADNTTSTINQRPLTVTFKTVSKIYDGKTTVELPTTTQYYTLNGKLDSDVIDLATENLSAEYADKNAGENKTVYYKGVALTGVPAGNYALTSATATGLGSIHKAGVHITAFADTTKVYDGTTAAPFGAATFDGLIDADEGKVGVTGTAVYDGKDVGDHTVSYSGLSLTGTEARNYQLDTFSLGGNGTITRRPLWLVATPQTITEGEATPTTWSGNLTGFVAGEGLGANDVYFFALDDPAASAAGKYSVTGTLSVDGGEATTSGDYGDNYTFANAAANATAFTINAYVPPAPEPTPEPTPKPQPTPTPKPQDIVEKITNNPGAAKEYTDVMVSLNSGTNTVLPTANVLPTESVVPTNSVLPTGNNQPTGSAQPTEKAQENNSVSGEQNETQEQNGSLPAQPTTGGQSAAGRQETQLGITYTDINMPKSMSVEALAAALNGETTATLPNNAGGEVQPTGTQGAPQEGGEEEA